MRKAPFRSSNEISQVYGDGVVKIYTVTDIAPPGYQPKLEPKLKETLYFAEQALGITRIYQSRQAMAEIEKVIRVQRRPVSPKDVAVLHDGSQYRIETVQAVQEVWPESLDLALRRLSRTEELKL